MPRIYRRLARATFGAVAAISIGCSDGTGPGLSPLPGQPIVFMRPFSGWDIVRINPDGTGEATLTTNPGDDTNPSWSADRKRIAYVSSGAAGIGVYVMDADGNNQRLVFRPDFAELNLPDRPAWAPDQQWLAYFERFNLIRVRLDGTDERLIGQGAWSSWSRDGQRIAFMWNGAISVSNIDGSNRRPVVASGSFPAWSPDGRRIAYAAGDFGSRFIYTVNVDGTDARRITEMTDSTKITDESPAWSPDGRWIAFQREHGCVSLVYCIGAWDIFLTRVNGTDLRQVTTNGKSVRPSW
jgi:TolB protein